MANGEITPISALVAASGTTSESCKAAVSRAGYSHMGDYVVCGVQIPSVWTAGDVTFEVSSDDPETVSDTDATWTVLNDPASGADPIKIDTATASKTYPLKTWEFWTARRVRAVVPSNAAERTIKFLVAPRG